MGGFLEQPLEVRGGGAVAPGVLERAADLAGDLGLADDDGLEPARHGEQVLHDVLAAEHVDRITQFGGVQVARSGHGLHGGGDGGVAVVAGDVEVGLETVAGGEDDGAVQDVGIRHEVACCGRGSDAQSLQEVEAGVAMRRRETDEHVANGNALDGTIIR
ncbi:hypothetical protein QP157_03350 [Sphingomonas sp. LR61]